MKRSGSAVWKGGLKDGRGTISTQSGVLQDTQYSFSTRFEEGKGTNPEELIAAAHAGCFTMALSAQLDTAGKKAESIQTEAVVTMDKTDAGFTITAVHLKVRAKVPGAVAAGIPDGCGERQEGLSGFARAERADHDGSKARRLDLRVGLKPDLQRH